MKNIHNISKLFIAALVLVACNAEEPGELDPNLHNPNPNTPAVTAGTVTAKVDGVDQTATFVTANYAQVFDATQNAMVPNPNELIIEATTSGGTISLNLLTNTPASTTTHVLSDVSTDYYGMYNTSITEVSTSTVHSNFQMEFDGQTWITDAQNFSVLGGVAALHGTKQAGTSINETLNIDLDTDQPGTYTFGPQVAPLAGVNTASYVDASTPGIVWTTDQVNTNGNITLNLDAVNKLASGSFSFDGIRTNVMPIQPNYGTTDTDGDGVVDLLEQALNTDENDANSPIQVAGYTGYNGASAIWMAADGDGDSVTNGDEIIAGTDPYEGNLDGDGDGVSDLQEAAAGTDETDPCVPAQNEFYTAYDNTNTVWQAADCDGDGLTNLQELEGLDGNILTTADTTNPYFVEVTLKAYTNGTFINVPYNDGAGAIVRGLRILSHDTAAKTISGTFSFISNSIGETPVRSYVISEGTFSVSYAD